MKSVSRSSKADTKRTELIAAATRLVVRDGIRAASVRAVAAEAQISVGSVLYYFSSIDQLLHRTLESVMDRYYAQRLRVIAGQGTATERLRRLIELGVPDEIGDDLSRLYESIALKPTGPDSNALHQGLFERQVSLYTTIIDVGTETGEFAPRSPTLGIAQNLVALEDAYDLYPVIGVDLSGEDKRANVLAYAELALGCAFGAKGA